MAQANRVFPYREDSTYHLYNRGNNKQIIFLDSNDYWTFRRILKRKLTLHPTVSLEYFVLMPNHFHLLLYQENERDIVSFMRGLSISYTSYMQKKYQRTGRVFGSSYRAVILLSRNQRTSLLKYLEKNPQKAGLGFWKHQGISP